jgi:hypothetical protein
MPVIIEKYRFVLSLIMLSLLILFSGCVTTKISYVEEDKLPKDKVYRIAEVYMKDGSVIDLKETEPKFKAEYKGINNVIIYYDKEYNTKYIELKNIDRLKIEIYESNVLLNVLLIAGGLVIVFFILFYIGLSSVGNITG